jgi:hypothetical protein
MITLTEAEYKALVKKARAWSETPMDARLYDRVIAAQTPPKPR